MMVTFAYIGLFLVLILCILSVWKDYKQDRDIDAAIQRALDKARSKQGIPHD